MAGFVGREALLKKGGAVIASIRVVGMSWSGESVDVTTGEDNGVRLLLAASGQEQVDFSIEGVVKDNVIRNVAMTPSASKMLTDVTFDFGIAEESNTTAATLTGDFRLSAYEEGNPYSDAGTLSATLESSGIWVFTPEAA